LFSQMDWWNMFVSRKGLPPSDSQSVFPTKNKQWHAFLAVKGEKDGHLPRRWSENLNSSPPHLTLSLSSKEEREKKRKDSEKKS